LEGPLVTNLVQEMLDVYLAQVGLEYLQEVLQERLEVLEVQERQEQQELNFPVQDLCLTRCLPLNLVQE
jgi:hypothetical protein